MAAGHSTAITCPSPTQSLILELVEAKHAGHRDFQTLRPETLRDDSAQDIDTLKKLTHIEMRGKNGSQFQTPGCLGFVQLIFGRPEAPLSKPGTPSAQGMPGFRSAVTASQLTLPCDFPTGRQCQDVGPSYGGCHSHGGTPTSSSISIDGIFSTKIIQLLVLGVPP